MPAPEIDPSALGRFPLTTPRLLHTSNAEFTVGTLPDELAAEWAGRNHIDGELPRALVVAGLGSIASALNAVNSDRGVAERREARTVNGRVPLLHPEDDAMWVASSFQGRATPHVRAVLLGGATLLAAARAVDEFTEELTPDDAGAYSRHPSDWERVGETLDLGLSGREVTVRPTQKGDRRGITIGAALYQTEGPAEKMSSTIVLRTRPELQGVDVTVRSVDTSGNWPEAIPRPPEDPIMRLGRMARMLRQATPTNLI